MTELIEREAAVRAIETLFDDEERRVPDDVCPCWTRQAMAAIRALPAIQPAAAQVAKAAAREIYLQFANLSSNDFDDPSIEQIASIITRNLGVVSPAAEAMKAVYDDSEPLLAALDEISRDGYATDNQRRVAQWALETIQRLQQVEVK